jgi:hypothetical protein
MFMPFCSGPEPRRQRPAPLKQPMPKGTEIANILFCLAYFFPIARSGIRRSHDAERVMICNYLDYNRNIHFRFTACSVLYMPVNKARYIRE